MAAVNDELPLVREATQYRYGGPAGYEVVAEFPLCHDVAAQLIHQYGASAPCRVLVLPGVYAEIRETPRPRPVTSPDAP